MRSSAISIFILLSGLFLLPSCHDGKSSFKLKNAILKDTDQHDQNKEESFEYFLFKSAIESFPFNQEGSQNFYREFIKSKYNSSTKKFYRDLPKWESIGPENIPGRVLSLAINSKDTNQLWMGSAGAGLWKSIKGGTGNNAWQYISTGYPVSSVSSIAIQENNPNIIYIGTGEIYNFLGTNGGIQERTLRGSRGMGILKSINGGITWKLCLDWSSDPQTAVWKIIIDPLNPQLVYAATNIGIYKSTDEGIHWNRTLDIPMIMDLIIDHINPEILYAAAGGLNGTHYGVYKTTDHGENWRLISTPNDTIYSGRIMLANYRTNPKRVMAIYSTDFKTISMMRSRNSFDSFNFYFPIKDVTEHQGWYSRCLYIKDNDSSKIIAGGVDLYTDTTGTGNQLFNLLNWKIKIHADLHDIISNPQDPEKIYIATDGGLFRSDNFGKTFSACNQGFSGTQFYTGFISNRTGNILGGLQDNKSGLRTGHTEWINFHQADGAYNAFHPESDSIIYIASQYQNLYRSSDFGKSWTELLKPNLNAAFIAPFMINPSAPNIIYVGGSQLLFSADGGMNWDSTNLLTKDESIVAIELNPQNTKDIYFSSLNFRTKESHLYHSADGGHHLELRESGIPERFIRDIAFDTKNSEIMYLALGGNNPAGIMKSNNKAESWNFTGNKNLPDVPFHSILVDPKDNNVIYAGSDLGLFVSADQGESWMSYNQHGFDVVPVYDIKYSTIDNKLIIFTHGFGAFRCALFDPTIITNSPSSSDEDILITQLNNYVQIYNLIPELTYLDLIDLEGKILKLHGKNSIFSTDHLEAGIYFISSSIQKLNGRRIVILR